MARRFANYKIRRIEPVLKPTLRADSLGTDSSAQAARVGSKIEPKFGSGADFESLHLELSPSLYIMHVTIKSTEITKINKNVHCVHIDI